MYPIIKNKLNETENVKPIITIVKVYVWYEEMNRAKPFRLRYMSPVVVIINLLRVRPNTGISQFRNKKHKGV